MRLEKQPHKTDPAKRSTMFAGCSKATVLIGAVIAVAIGLAVYLWGFGGMEAITSSLNGQSGNGALNNGTDLTSAPSTPPSITASPTLPTTAPTTSSSNASVTIAPTASTQTPTAGDTTDRPTSLVPTSAPTGATTTATPSASPSFAPTISSATESPTPGEATAKPTWKYNPYYTKSPTHGADPTSPPTASTDSPTSSNTNAPTASTGAPTTSTGTPTSATSSPTGTTDSPTGSTESPTVSSEAPTVSTNAPTPSTQSPTVSTESPTTSTGSGLNYVRVVFTDEASTSASVRAAFESAAQRWSDILKNFQVEEDTVPANFGFNANAGCRLNTEAIVPAGPISQLTIAAEIGPIDGQGSVLGQAGFCGVFQLKKGSTTTFVPLIGQMTFDSADLANLEAAGTLEAVILHEMGHVIGIGTMWNLDFSIRGNAFPQLLKDAIFQIVNGRFTTNPFNDPLYVGASAKAAFAALGGAGDVPVEDGSFRGFSAQQIRLGQGRGSIDSHWRENTFVNELMTPALNGGGVANPLSQLSLRSLEDLSYDVDVSLADSYAIPASRSFGGDSGSALQEEVSLEGDIVMPSEDVIQRGIENVRRRARSKRRLTGRGAMSVFDFN